MINLFFFSMLALVGIVSWKILKAYEKKEAELIAEYNRLKREHGLR